MSLVNLSGVVLGLLLTARAFCCADIPWFVSPNRCWVKLMKMILYYVARLYSSSPDCRWEANGTM